MKDESCWKIVKEGFEMYAHNSLETINDLIRFFQDSGLQVGTMNGRVVYNQNLVARALRNSLYA
jgi:hypothetical protein